MKTLLLLFLCFLFWGLDASSQNLSGTWEGGGTGGFFRLVIIQQGDSCFGYTYNIQRGCCKANFSGTYNETTKKFKGHRIDFIDKLYGESLFTFNLNYSEKEGISMLIGKSSSISRGNDPSLAFPYAFTFCKKSDFFDTTKFMTSKITHHQSKIDINKNAKEFFTPEDLRLVKESRTSTLVKTLETQADSIKLVLYDNGEIDGDTVTVFYNAAIIYNSVLLTSRPLEIMLPVNKTNAINTIELMANNLGSIPPNTALLLIYAGKERNELRVSSDYSTNARIDIKHIDHHD